MTDAPDHEFTDGLYGHITHTDLATHDPGATRAWASEVFGWAFPPPFDTPGGAYHLFSFSEQGGGGIRATQPGEEPGCTPSVHVASTDDAYAAALAAGAEGVSEPHTLAPGVRIALVRAPGGVLVGLSGPS